MTDTSSSGGAPSPVVCPLAKLGRLSPTSVRLAYTNGASGDSGFDANNVQCVPSPSLAFRNRRPLKNGDFFITKSSSSSDHNKLSPSKRASVTLSDSSIGGGSGNGSCSAGGNSGGGGGGCRPNVISYSPAYQYQQNYCDYNTSNKSSSAVRQFYRNKNEEADENGFFRATSLKCHTTDRTSPYMDQGYHTLVPPSPPPNWPVIVAPSKCAGKKSSSQNKFSHFDRLTDDVILRIFSRLNTNELCLTSRVCRRWYNLAWDPSLWSTIALNGERTCADKAIKSILRRLCGQGHNGTCAGVKQLFVYEGANISDKGLISLSRRCTELTHVQLQNCTSLTDSAVSELMTRCSSIQHLDVTGCSLVSSINIVPGPNMPQKLLVQYLDLTDCLSVQDSSLRIILRNCPQLTYLYLRRCSRITDGGVKFVPSFCCSLREFSVSDCHQVTDFALYELAKLGSNLRYLSVAKCGRVSDVGLKVIAKRCYKLRYLNVRGCEAVSDDALTAVAQSCPRLRALDIGKCDVSDAGLKVLAENCPNLKKLSLRNCDLVTDRGIQFVCYYCRGLQQLNIQDCQISLEGYRAVKKFCKRCIIEHTNPGFF